MDTVLTDTSMTLDELVKRVQILEDIEEIKKLHTNYIYWLCKLQWDNMLDCFAEDATLELMDQGVRKGGKRRVCFNKEGIYSGRCW